MPLVSHSHTTDNSSAQMPGSPRILMIGWPGYTATDPFWSTYIELTQQGYAVEFLDARHYPHLLDPSGEPHADMLEGLVRVFKPSYIAYKGETAGEIVRALNSAGHFLPPGAQAPRRIVVFGYIGAGNFGDELIFDTIRHRLEQHYPGCIVSVIAHDAENCVRDQGVAAVVPTCKATIDGWLGTASAVLLNAGIMFDQPFEQGSGRIELFMNPYSDIAGQTAVVLLAHLNKVPVVYLGAGAGPLSNPDAQALIQLGSRFVSHYYVRDDVTHNLLANAGVDPALISRSADLAFSLDPLDNGSSASVEEPGSGSPSAQAAGQAKAGLLEDLPANTPYIIVAIRDHAQVGPELLHHIADNLDSLFATRHLHSVFLDLSPEDREVHKQIHSYMQHPEAAVYAPSSLGIDVQRALIAQAKLCFSMRLHGCVAAAIDHVPVVGLSYNVKVSEVYTQLGLEGWLLPMDCDRQRMQAALLDALDNARKQQDICNSALARNHELANASFEGFFRLMDSHTPDPAYLQNRPSYPLSCSGAEADLARERAARETAERNYAAAIRELKVVRTSTGWIVGRAITWVPRKLKDWYLGRKKGA